MLLFCHQRCYRQSKEALGSAGCLRSASIQIDLQPGTGRETGLNSTPYEELVKIVKNHYDPKPSVIMQRYKFNTRMRAASESITAYVAALRELAQHRKFKETLSDMLRGRLICGVNHKGITNRLLAEKERRT